MTNKLVFKAETERGIFEVRQLGANLYEWAHICGGDEIAHGMRNHFTTALYDVNKRIMEWAEQAQSGAVKLNGFSDS